MPKTKDFPDFSKYKDFSKRKKRHHIPKFGYYEFKMEIQFIKLSNMWIFDCVLFSVCLEFNQKFTLDTRIFLKQYAIKISKT